MPTRRKITHRQPRRNRRLLGRLLLIAAGVLVVTFLLIGGRSATSGEPAIPRGVALASWSENGHGGQYVLEILQGTAPRPGVTITGIVASDSACQPDAQGFNHCHNDIDLKNDGRITVINHHVMSRYRCLRPGEAVSLIRVNASWVIANVS